MHDPERLWLVRFRAFQFRLCVAFAACDRTFGFKRSFVLLIVLAQNVRRSRYPGSVVAEITADFPGNRNNGLGLGNILTANGRGHYGERVRILRTGILQGGDRDSRNNPIRAGSRRRHQGTAKPAARQTRIRSERHSEQGFRIGPEVGFCHGRGIARNVIIECNTALHNFRATMTTVYHLGVNVLYGGRIINSEKSSFMQCMPSSLYPRTTRSLDFNKAVYAKVSATDWPGRALSIALPV